MNELHAGIDQGLARAVDPARAYSAVAAGTAMLAFSGVVAVTQVSDESLTVLFAH